MKSSILIVLAVGFAGFGALEVAALNPNADPDAMISDTKGTDSSAPEAQTETSVGDEVSKSSPTDTKTDVRTGPAATCLTPALVAAFEPRHLALLDREAALDRRQAKLEALEATLATKLTDMGQARDALQAMTARLDTVANEDISHLVDMYSTMKAKKAAAIFDRMDPAFAAGFLREIDSARAGMIMAEMGEEQSYRISLLIANRHAEWRNP